MLEFGQDTVEKTKTRLAQRRKGAKETKTKATESTEK